MAKRRKPLAGTMANRLSKKTSEHSGSTQSKSKKKRMSTIQAASDAKADEFELQSSTASDDYEVDSANENSGDIYMITGNSLIMFKGGASKTSAKSKTATQGPHKLKRLCSTKSAPRSLPSRNLEPISDDEGIPLSKRGKQIKNESQVIHRCFDFAYRRSTVQPCCMAARIGCWNSENPPSRPKRGASIKDTCASSSSSKTSDLPGFYFDQEKGRYFRIVPSATNIMSNAVTRERLESEDHERLRQKELRSLEASGKLTDPKHQTTIKIIPNILTTVENSKTANLHPDALIHEMRRACVAKMGAHVGKDVHELKGAIIKKICLKSDEDKLLVSYQTRKKSCVAVLNIEYLGNDSSNLCENISFADLIFNSNKEKVVDLCFMPFPRGSAQTFVYCTEACKIHMLDERSLFMEWGRKIEDLPLCCASRAELSAFGTERAVYVSQHLTMDSYIEMKKYNTSKTAVHSVAFANESKNLLFCGARNQRILLFDQRSSTMKPVAYLTQQSGFSGDLYVTKDDRYLLSAALNTSQIQRWDIRQGQVVVDYPGHVNNDSLRTPLVVDTDDDFFCAVGTDGYTRIWDLRSGELMKVLPPPLPTTRESLPSVCFLSSSQNGNIHPGLLMGISNEFHFFSF